jgi:hypothetical protein
LFQKKSEEPFATCGSLACDARSAVHSEDTHGSRQSSGAQRKVAIEARIACELSVKVALEFGLLDAQKGPLRKASSIEWDFQFMIQSIVMKIAAPYLLLLASTVATVPAATILSVGGPNVNNPLGIFPASTVAFSFTVGQAYSNVSISADLIGSFIGTAYLTTQIGPTTTIANQIAASSFTSAGGFLGVLQPVLQNISINPGTYFLVLSTAQANPPQGLQETNSPVTTADVEASTNGALLSSSTGAAFAPSDTFSVVNPGAGAYAPQFNITGTSTTPEPATWFLLSSALALLRFHRHRTREVNL